MVDKELLPLFCECFPDTVNEAEIILGLAEKQGKIHKTHINGVLASVICTSPIKDRDFCAEYIFACGTKPEFRGKGLFRNQLDKVIGEKAAILIPENEGLFAMYERLGFKTVYCLKAHFGGSGIFCSATAEEAISACENACLFPKKSGLMLEAATKAFLSYGNEIKKCGDAVLLMQDGVATEIFAKSESEMLSAARACETALLPLSMQSLLDRENIKYEITKLASAKNIPDEVLQRIFINNLFN